MAGYLSEGTAEIRTVAVADLKPAPYNPRRIDPAAMAGLTKSLERFGYVEPIIWNQRRCRMVEIDPAYCDVIRDRWQSLTGGKATLNAPAP